MARNTSGFPGDRPKESLVTLPRIRDVFGEQLNSPSANSSPRSRSSHMAGSDPASYMPASSRRSSSSQDVHYVRQDGTWGASASPRNTAGDLRQQSPRAYGATPDNYLRRSTSDYAGSHRPSPVIPPVQPYPPSSGGHYAPSATSGHYRSTPNRVNDPSRPPPAPSSAWADQRRRDSADPARSSSSSGVSSRPRTNSSANALQFQPLPHSQMAPVNPRPSNRAHNPTQQTPADFQSPFGVLIADMDLHGVSPSDPQRQAIMRIRAQGGQSSFPVNFDDPSNPHNSSMRYACQYCGKRFTRPSSLRIHNNSHTGEKPFECPHDGCGRRFSVHSNMRRHARVHEGGAPKGGESSGEED